MPYNDPDIYKDIARKKLIKAVQRGKILRPNECEDCGIEGVPQGHHPDYSKPLEVIWLCASCHSMEHFRINRDKRTNFYLTEASRIAQGILGL